jgi:hypothetical protein
MPAERLTFLSEVDASTATALETEPLITCFLGKIFYASRHRNTYFGRDSNRYFSATAFHQDPGLLKGQIRRARASKWRIG